MILTPITNPVALKLDTTVGTRIFAGTTMIYGDTGWRNVTAMITPSWTYGDVFVRRINERVFIKIGNSSPPIDSVFTLDLTTAWRSDSNTAFIRVLEFGRITINWNGSMNIKRTLTGGNIATHEFYITNAAWPASLPGTPA